MTLRSTSKLDRLRHRRPLHCEPLEKRELLAALIAASEVVPGSAEVFKLQAKTFIESALELVTKNQEQTPVNSSIDTTSSIAADGQSVRVTNYTIELAPNPSPSTIPVRPVPASPANSLTFSFMVYADSSVSMRARLNGPSSVAFPLSSPNSAFRDTLARPQGANTPLSSDHVSDEAYQTANPESNRSWIAEGEATGEKKAVLTDYDSSDPSRGVFSRGQLADIVFGPTNDALNLEFETLGSTSDQLAIQEISGRVETRMDVVGLDFDGSGWRSANRTEIAAPSDLIRLEYAELRAERAQAVDSASSFAAIFQVFVHADGAEFGRIVQDVANRAPSTASVTSETHQAGYQAESLAILSLACGFWIARKQRATNSMLAHQKRA